MTYAALALISTCIFALVHLFAQKTCRWKWVSQSNLLSFGSGVAIAYVFIDLLPKLCKRNIIVSQALSGVFPYFEHHVYLMALVGFVLFYWVDRGASQPDKNRRFFFSIGSYALFNFMVGYAVVDKDNPEVQPLVLFTIAMALHYFANDYHLFKTYGNEYSKKGKWILILALFLGWLTGALFTLSTTAVALVSAFIGGGVIMNVIRHELPVEKPNNLNAFLIGALLYTLILLFIG